MATTNTSTAVSMKLLIDSKAQRVLFSEAGKEVVDFLFSLLALPLGTAIKLFTKESMVGCVGNLYASIEKLDATYVQPGVSKNSILRPTLLCPVVSFDTSVFRLLEPSSAPSKRLFRCNYTYNDTCSTYMTDVSGTKCPSCGDKMTADVKFVSQGSRGSGQLVEAATKGAKGFVQGIMTYTVMDDLTVTPMSSISSIAPPQHLCREGHFLRSTVQIGYKEFKTVLTDVFLAKKSPRRTA